VRTDQSALEQLLGTEARLDHMLFEERARADALLRSAEEEAAELEQRLEGELVAVTAEVDRRLGMERDTRLAVLEDEAHRALAQFESVTPEHIRELAGWVVDQVLSSMEGNGS
jgi:hypothetical protein